MDGPEAVVPGPGADGGRARGGAWVGAAVEETVRSISGGISEARPVGFPDGLDKWCVTEGSVLTWGMARYWQREEHIQEQGIRAEDQELSFRCVRLRSCLSDMQGALLRSHSYGSWGLRLEATRAECRQSLGRPLGPSTLRGEGTEREQQMRLSLSSWGQEGLREECLEAKQRAVGGGCGPLCHGPGGGWDRTPDTGFCNLTLRRAVSGKGWGVDQ